MGKDESFLTQAIDTLAFLLGFPAALYRNPRNIVETLTLLQSQKGDECDYLFLSEILPRDQKAVDILLETWGYKQGIWGSSGGRTPLCSVLASKHDDAMLPISENIIGDGWGYGALFSSQYSVPIYGLHFGLTERSQKNMRSYLIEEAHDYLKSHPYVVVMGDLNQSFSSIESVFQGTGLAVIGTKFMTHRILGYKLTGRNLDNILIICREADGDMYKKFSNYEVFRGRSDHTFVMMELNNT